MAFEASQSRVRLGWQDRETSRHYIPLSEQEQCSMMESLGISSLRELYGPIADEFLFQDPPALPPELAGDALRREMEAISMRNKVGISLIGDGLPDYEVHPIVGDVLAIRELATAYTPYQPERSQGTLISQWLYQCGMAALTGFEAINASLYDRSTAIFEACLTAIRISRSKSRVLISEGIFPGDREVLVTHFQCTEHELEWIPLDPKTGLLDGDRLRTALTASANTVAAVVFPQVNSLGYLEDVDAITLCCEEHACISIAVVDPLHLSAGGLKPPAAWGKHGTDFVVGEAQHLALKPCFGGPGLGLFGVRTDERRKNFVRSTPGRYVGKARDEAGRDCFVAVMSAREQHIRKDKATSNICSNQAFIATLAGASMLACGDEGLASKFTAARRNAQIGSSLFLSHPSFKLAYPANIAVNEVTFSYTGDLSELLRRASGEGIQLGIDVSDRIAFGQSMLKVSFHDRQLDWTRVANFLGVEGWVPSEDEAQILAPIPESSLRIGTPGIPSISREELAAYYHRLGSLNLSPDNGIYPLGSCTMKYNPVVNEWAAGLRGFQDIHPQASIDASQGCLQVLFEIQEWFKAITGLAGVTTQPLAGAQGELVGIKLFQAYHADRGQDHRDIVLIPATAHGTNFATAVVAGYAPGRRGARDAGVVVLKTDPLGGIDLDDFEAKIGLYGDRLVGIMITNPNTCGVFESNFRKIADRVHEAGGLVYMDGANMNAIAGWVNLESLGVDAVHNNIHKTWSIPHGGGGPGDGFVAVSSRLLDYLPGHQIIRQVDGYQPVKAPKSIGSFHRHWGNFNHKVRCLTYLKALGKEGVPRMSATSVLAARYLFKQLERHFDELPFGSRATPRMHEFVISFQEEIWQLAESAGIAKTAVMPGLGKLFLDFGYHAPTVAFPEPLGVMVEPTESYSRAELDRFCEVAVTILELIRKNPLVLKTAPHFTPVGRVDEVGANRSPELSEVMDALPVIHPNRRAPLELMDADPAQILQWIMEA
jgi:glycine dehydrogenase